MSYTSANQQTSTVSAVKTLPRRVSPTWVAAETTQLENRDVVEKVITGNLPVGIIPFEIISEAERLSITSCLKKLQIKKYENTSETEKVFVHGHSFVDSPSLDEYLRTEKDELFEMLTQPLLQKLIRFFLGKGFDVQPLTDPVTLLPYHAGVCRQISIPDDCYTDNGNNCTVLHCDDLLRDGASKKDFRIPLGLEQMQYNQFSVCVQLEDGGYRPDDIIVYEKQYSRELEPGFYGEGAWRYNAKALEGCRSHGYTPQLRKCYMFSTLNFHDVRGGHRLSQRINFSVFFIYVKATNTLYYYN